MPELFKIATAYKKRTTGGGGGDTTAPTVSSRHAIDTTTVRIVFSENTTPSLLGWSFTKNGSPLSLDAVASVNATTWDFSVAAMNSDDVITVSYNSATGDTVDDSANELASFTNAAVTNDIAPEVPFDLGSATHKTVKYGGTAGVDCDYESITDGLDDLRAFNTPGPEIILDVNDGDHTDTGQFDSGFGLSVGMYMKHNLHIIGTSRAGTIINGAQAASSANEALVDTIHIPATCLIERLTLKAHNCKYAIHCDYNSGNYEYSLYVRDCDLKHDSSVIQPPIAVGAGMYGNQSLHFIDCEFFNDGFYGHGIDTASIRDLAKHFELHFIRCTMTKLEWHDQIEYSANKMFLTDCVIGEIILNSYAAEYDAHPGDPKANQGFKTFIDLTASGNTITTVTRNAEAAGILGSAFSTPADFL